MITASLMHECKFCSHQVELSKASSSSEAAVIRVHALPELAKGGSLAFLSWAQGAPLLDLRLLHNGRAGRRGDEKALCSAELRRVSLETLLACPRHLGLHRAAARSQRLPLVWTRAFCFCIPLALPQGSPMPSKSKWRRRCTMEPLGPQTEGIVARTRGMSAKELTQGLGSPRKWSSAAVGS